MFRTQNEEDLVGRGTEGKEEQAVITTALTAPSQDAKRMWKGRSAAEHVKTIRQSGNKTDRSNNDAQPINMHACDQQAAARAKLSHQYRQMHNKTRLVLWQDAMTELFDCDSNIKMYHNKSMFLTKKKK